MCSFFVFEFTPLYGHNSEARSWSIHVQRVPLMSGKKNLLAAAGRTWLSQGKEVLQMLEISVFPLNYPTKLV